MGMADFTFNAFRTIYSIDSGRGAKYWQHVDGSKAVRTREIEQK